MADQHGRRGQGGDDFDDVGDILVDAQVVEVGLPPTLAVSRQRKRIRSPAALGEPGQKVFLPAPCANKGTVHEKQRCPVRSAGGGRQAAEDFERVGGVCCSVHCDGFR